MPLSETFSELKGLLRSIVKWVIILLVLAFYFFVWPFGNSFAVQVFGMMRADLVPTGVNLIVSNPFTAFLIEMKIAFFLGFVFALPFLLWAILKYISPALKSGERRAVYMLILPSFTLFVSGCVFSYLFVVPATIKILYSYTPDIGVTPFFEAGDFISMAFGFMAVTGLMFLLPVAMFISSYLGIIKYEFWKNHWRHTFFIFVVFTAVITPDGTGITMMLLLAPLSLLYFFGMLSSRRYRAKGI